jgi:hypothetical protein
MNAIERETELKEVTQSFNASTSETYDYNYDNYYDSGAYGSESYDTTAQDQSTAGASATQGADTTAEQPQGEQTATALAPEQNAAPGEPEDQPVKS